jgi:hypothetical protein
MDGSQGESRVPVLVIANAPQTGKASVQQTAKTADRLAVLLTGRFRSGPPDAHGTTVYCGTREQLSAAVAALQAELAKDPDYAGKMPDSLRKQCQRARDELKKQGKLAQQGDAWVLSLPYSDPFEEVPF